MVTIEWMAYRAFPTGGIYGIDPLKYFGERGILVYRSQIIHEAATAFEIDKLPDPCPEFIKEINGFSFTRRETVYQIKKPLDIVELKKWMDEIIKFAEANKEACEFGIDLNHEPTKLLDGFCEGNRSMNLWIKEARPAKYYIDRFNAGGTNSD